MHTIVHPLIAALRLETTGVPIYVQLRDQALRALAAGTLGPGDQMPTMRQVAVALKIDLNTVRHAYDELERLGAITLMRGRGSFVSDRIPAEPAADPVDQLARQVLTNANAAGIDIAALATRLVALVAQKEDLK